MEALGSIRLSSSSTRKKIKDKSLRFEITEKLKRKTEKKVVELKVAISERARQRTSCARHGKSAWDE